jgi:hypothetical protein
LTSFFCRGGSIASILLVSIGWMLISIFGLIGKVFGLFQQEVVGFIFAGLWYGA